MRDARHTMPWLFEEEDSLEESPSSETKKCSPKDSETSRLESSSLSEMSDKEDFLFNPFSKNTSPPKKRAYPSALTVVLLCISFLLLCLSVWIGVGVLMKFGVLPWTDIGYSALDSAIEGLKGASAS